MLPEDKNKYSLGIPIISIFREISFVTYYFVKLYGLKSHTIYFSYLKSFSFVLTILLLGPLCLAIK